MNDLVFKFFFFFFFFSSFSFFSSGSFLLSEVRDILWKLVCDFGLRREDLGQPV